MNTYYLDPDNRRDAPRDKPFCVRCHKAIKDVAKAVLVTVNYDRMEVVEGGNMLLGRDCWRQITRV